MKILEVRSSARSSGSHSTRLAGELVARLRAAHPAAQHTLRDLAAQPHPALDEAALQALFTPVEQRSAEQAARVALNDALIAEVQAADTIVIGAPMYNFSVSAQLKNWIDAIARAGVTFRYTERGPVGLLAGKKVYVVTTRGGIHRDTPTDSQTPFLRQVLGFLGLVDVEFVYAEGLNMGAEAEQRGLSEAQRQIEAVLAG